MEPRLFFLFGAGASADAGVPVCVRFVEDFEQHLSRLRGNEVLGQTLDRIKRTLSKSGVDLESLYEFLDDAIAGGSQRPDWIANNLRTIERLHVELMRCIQDKCFIGARQSVAYLAGWLLPVLQKQKRLTIASLNYDTVVEEFCRRYRITCKDRALTSAPGRKGIELLKLHGSVTWIRTQGRLRQALTQAEATLTLGALRSPLLERPLVYPTRHKFPASSRLLRLALRFGQVARTNDWCVAVGYQFGDQHVRHWLGEAMDDHHGLRLLVVSPDPTQTLRNLAGQDMPSCVLERTWAIAQGFATAIQENDLYQLLARTGTNSTARGPAVLRAQHGRHAQAECIARGIKASGLATDGERIFVTVAKPPQVLSVALGSGKQRTITTKVQEPRGIARFDEDSVIVVEKVPCLGSQFTGPGALRLINMTTGQREPFYAPSERAAGVIELFRGACGLHAFHALRWPTAVLVHPQHVWATEARQLVCIDRTSREIVASVVPNLAFNFNALAPGLSRDFFALDYGVARRDSVGRLYHIARDKEGAWAARTVFEFQAGITAVVLRQDEVLLCAPSYRGGCILRRCAHTGEQRADDIFFSDSPVHILAHPLWDFLIVATNGGLWKVWG